MARNHSFSGKVLDYVNGGTPVTSGSGVLMGALLGVALVNIAANATGSVQVCGVFTLPKLATDTMAQGALLYWDNTNRRLTTTAAGNTLAGNAAVAAAATTTTVQVLLNGVPD